MTKCFDHPKEIVINAPIHISRVAVYLSFVGSKCNDSVTENYTTRESSKTTGKKVYVISRNVARQEDDNNQQILTTQSQNNNQHTVSRHSGPSSQSNLSLYDAYFSECSLRFEPTSGADRIGCLKYLIDSRAIYFIGLSRRHRVI